MGVSADQEYGDEPNTIGITTEHTVWCSRCSEWDQQPEPTKKGMAAMAKINGWRLRRRRWLCPDCVEEKT